MSRLLNVQEIADYLGVKPGTIYQWTHQGYIPHVKFKKNVRFRMAEIEKWVEKRAVAGRQSMRLDVLS
jgi:excisionase family DNA binding protein